MFFIYGYSIISNQIRNFLQTTFFYEKIKKSIATRGHVFIVEFSQQKSLKSISNIKY